jgi:hypothetical protein
VVIMVHHSGIDISSIVKLFVNYCVHVTSLIIIYKGKTRCLNFISNFTRFRGTQNFICQVDLSCYNGSPQELTFSSIVKLFVNF